jgi:DNA-binding response OmpR family regulator
MRILVIEDEKELAANLKEILINEKYTVSLSSNGEDALDRALTDEFDLIILDIMLPKIDGLTILKEIRKKKVNTPVLLLTARTSIEDKVKGLDTGADDYLPKPFAVPELLARIRSLLRRESQAESSELILGNLRIDLTGQKVYRGKKEIVLTPKEFSILEFLFYNKDIVVSRTAIAEHVWGDNFDLFTMTNFVDVHIKNLRKKIDRDFSPKLIHTRHGIGYVLSDKHPK